MKCVNQITDDDCMRCCVASILEVPYAIVPNLAKHGWEFILNRWLKRFRLVLLTVEANEKIQFWSAYHIICGISRREKEHACVARASKIVFDPHPSRDGLVTVQHYDFFVATDPWELNHARS